MDEIKQIDSNLYNNKWQELIDSLLELDYKKRFDINQVNKFLKEKIKIKDRNLINKAENEINNMNINNKNNKIKGEKNIEKNDTGKNMPIIK